jgi:hypothetical protein
MGEFNSKGTILSVAAIPQSGDPSYKKLYGLFTVPEMGGTPEMIDVTNLEDGIKRNIPGIGDTGTLDFEFYATEQETDTSSQIRDTWNILRGYQTAGTSMMWKLEYPDGEGFTWQGKCTVRRQSVSVNSAIKFTLTIGLETALTDIVTT